MAPFLHLFKFSDEPFCLVRKTCITKSSVLFVRVNSHNDLSNLLKLRLNRAETNQQCSSSRALQSELSPEYYNSCLLCKYVRIRIFLSFHSGAECIIKYTYKRCQVLLVTEQTQKQVLSISLRPLVSSISFWEYYCVEGLVNEENTTSQDKCSTCS